MAHPLEETIGYVFQEPSLRETALSHPSLGKKTSNQRLEFLGDAVLGLLMAELLYDQYPQEPEGDLARRHAALVRGETLAAIAQEIGLGTYLHLSSSEAQSGGREAPSNLEDAMEALIGALYLDGGLAAAKSLVQRYWNPRAATVSTPPKDAKTALQEWSQARGLRVPEYVVVTQIGPAHAPAFTVEVRIPGHGAAQATAASKRAAEQQAAAHLLASVQPS